LRQPLLERADKGLKFHIVGRSSMRTCSIRSRRCVRAASGHAAAPPSVAMNSRRRSRMLMCPFRARKPLSMKNSTARASRPCLQEEGRLAPRRTAGLYEARHTIACAR
jgi:hypothetical protein